MYSASMQFHQKSMNAFIKNGIYTHRKEILVDNPSNTVKGTSKLGHCVRKLEK